MNGPGKMLNMGLSSIKMTQQYGHYPLNEEKLKSLADEGNSTQHEPRLKITK
ncbi:hypothetical protein MCOR02_002896 [Pyricularia oryzae]|uniref:Uncharacterized protein n=2 Tax=Pyricularia oryzae TaxID=318829 RepID=G4MYD5_PYRO7|nr:uncharacterized protein MGG_15821 [Pyricularia oryzae 70-15]KAH9439335.1 hypothetical protein MCOR02_002896 [Pyricularia oryzae]EHA55270.1 hypothetical protein MGG_15821 [Pyricularia oryzae 70-15]KAI7916036.1 hypothetical protein M0657_008790 [Pyricularia oryzae]KAI7926250.1 hypothetical protein M9X92_002840 [Pyricularia oryzae]QBZ56950.1 hypothetical protein PoMZ_01868 [Pyricularia oryzae]